MSSIIGFEPYVVRTGRGDPFVQSGIHRRRVVRGISFGPDSVLFKMRSSGSVSFNQ
jgi:hypothetical protein